MDRSEIISGLKRLGELAGEKNIQFELVLYGGAALLIAHNARPMTKDIDAVIIGDKSKIQPLLNQVAEEFGWSSDWLNDGVKGFISDKPEIEALNINMGISVHVASAPYLFAMKALSMRSQTEAADRDDLKFLAKECGIGNLEDALAIVEKFYPRRLISPKTQFGLEEIFEELGEEETNGPDR